MLGVSQIDIHVFFINRVVAKSEVSSIRPALILFHALMLLSYIRCAHILARYSTWCSPCLFALLQYILSAINNVVYVILSPPEHAHEIVGLLQSCPYLLLMSTFLLFSQGLLLFSLKLQLFLDHELPLSLLLFQLTPTNKGLLFQTFLILKNFYTLPFLSLPEKLTLDAGSLFL